MLRTLILPPHKKYTNNSAKKVLKILKNYERFNRNYRYQYSKRIA